MFNFSQNAAIEIRITHCFQLPGEGELLAFTRALLKAATLVTKAAAAAGLDDDSEPASDAALDAFSDLRDLPVVEPGSLAVEGLVVGDPANPTLQIPPGASVSVAPAATPARRKRRTRAEMAALRAEQMPAEVAAMVPAPAPVAAAPVAAPPAPVADAVDPWMPASPAQTTQPQPGVTLVMRPTVETQPNSPLGASQPTLAEVKNEFARVLDLPGGENVLAGVLAKFKAATFGAVPVDRYAELVTDLKIAYHETKGAKR